MGTQPERTHLPPLSVPRSLTGSRSALSLGVVITGSLSYTSLGTCIVPWRGCSSRKKPWSWGRGCSLDSGR
eukprot:scaffold186176_cov22-Tisochrysis_lutea.AAC.1